MKTCNLTCDSILTYKVNVNLNKEPTLHQLEKLINNADVLDFQTSFLINGNFASIELSLKLSSVSERSIYVK